MANAAAAAMILLAIAGVAAADDDFTPDARTHDEVIAAVRAYEAIPPARDAEVIAELTRNQNSNPPPYAFELSRRLFSSAEAEARNEAEARYVIVLAALRTRYDALRCKNNERALVGGNTLDKAFPVQSAVIEPHATRALETGEILSTMETIHARDEVFRSRASPWWICSYGLPPDEAVVMAPHPEQWLKPKSEWKAIEADMRAKFEAALATERAAKR